MQAKQVRSILFTAVASLLVFWLLAVLDGINNYYTTRDATEARIMASARIIESRVQQSLRQAELFLDELSLSERYPDGPGVPPSAAHPDNELFDRLRTQLEQDALLRGKPQNMAIIGPDGIIRRATNATLVGRHTDNRYYFRYFLDHPGADRMIIGEIIDSPLGGKVFVVAKGYWNTDGSLDFVVSGSLPLDLLDDILRSTLPEAETGNALLSNEHGDVLARIPPLPGSRADIRDALPVSGLFRSRGEPVAFIDGISPYDGLNRIYAMRQSLPYNVEVAVSTASAEALRPWFRHLAILASITALISGLILFIARTAIVREVSRSKAEHRLRETESELRQAQKLARLGSWRPAADGIHVLLSDQMYSLLDLKPGTAITLDDLDSFVHPDDRLDVRAALENARKGLAVDLIHRIVTPCGLRWVRQRGDLTFDHTGAIIAGVCTLQDITRLKQAEELILQSRDHYLRLLESFPTLVWRSIADGLPRYFNQTWLDFTGRSLDQEQNSGWLSSVHDEDMTMVRDLFARGIAARTPFEVEFRLRRHDGDYRWLRCIARPFVDMDGTFAGYIGTCFDITEPRQLLENLERSNAELEQFAYIASHDLREPLRMISSYLNLIERRLGPTMTQEIAEFFAYARDGAQRMNRLILDVLEFSRVGRLSSPITRIDIADPLRQAIADLTAAIDESGAEIEVEGDLAPVQASRDEIIRLFQNLLSNAIKYRHPDRTPHIVVSCQPGRHMHQFTVRDNGIGVPPDQYERIFRIFQRLHDRDTKSGSSGIGLAICKKVAEFHGGRIWVTSDRDQDGNSSGSAFHFTLPAPPEDSLSLQSTD